MKIGEVAKRTGLTEKAVRVYVDNGLVHPAVERSAHRNAYDFSEANIKEFLRAACQKDFFDKLGPAQRAGPSFILLAFVPAKRR